MPHVVLTGQVEMEEVFRRLRPVFVKTERGILKATDAYIDRAGRNILVDSLSIEEGEQTRFMMMLSAREDGLVVRLFPGLEVQKTDGVKTVLAETTRQLMRAFPELEVGETNLGKYLAHDGGPGD
jgi:hypothetical protein